jgi:trehalose-6-phosphate synthase
MQYSFNLVTLPSECDSLTSNAERDKRNLLARKQNLTVRTENSAETVQENMTELARLNAELDEVNTTIAGMADGPKKEKKITERMEVEVRIRRINERTNKVTPVMQLDREYDLEQLDAQLQKADVFIAAVAAHKATL